jgi:hypothetical protein
MPGTYAVNLKEGSRSEILADYLFSQCGAVTPVRRQDDIGVDLYCTLPDRVGALGVVRDYFTVQVKSGTGPWEFKGLDSVRWLVEYPTPLFLACIEKKSGSVSVYHLMPRFHVSAQGRLPSRLELRPEDTEAGEFVQWETGESFSLSAPIIRATLGDLLDEEKMQALRELFSYWVGSDRENGDVVRQGLLRFRMPPSYRTNQLPNTGIAELGYLVLEKRFLNRGILRLAESTECIGGQLLRLGDTSGALRAALLVRHLCEMYPDVFKDQPRWNGTIPGEIRLLFPRLNEALREQAGPNYIYRGIDEIGKALDNNPIVKTLLTSGEQEGASSSST